MTARAAMTIKGEPETIERRWNDGERLADLGATATFTRAPGDRGTEVHLEFAQPGALGQAVGKLKGTEPMARAKDELRRFKQLVETGEIARSDGAPEGERVQRKGKQHPAQPLDASELEKAGRS